MFNLIFSFMSKLTKDFFTTNHLHVIYRDGTEEDLVLRSSECWHRFRNLSDFFANNPFSGIKEISILDILMCPIMSIKNEML